MSNLFLIFCLSLYLIKCQAFLNSKGLQEFLNTYVPFYQRDIHEKKNANTDELKESCDENQLLLQLARLYITSPERVILLLSSNSLSKTCNDVSDVLERMNNTMSGCIPLKPDNLYMKLNSGLDYFNSFVCHFNPTTREDHLIKYHTCLRELRDDLLDCEGPPDWFEKSNESVVCQYYNDIINCNYIKAAMLCGLKPAVMLRSFSDEIIKRIVKFNCKVTRSLPHIDDPMPATACHLKCQLELIFCTYKILHLFIYFCLYK